MNSETSDATYGDRKNRYQSTTPFVALNGLIEHWFCDRVGQVRRPTLLLAVICIDLAILALTGFCAYILTVHGDAMDLPATSIILIMPWLTISVLHVNWSYSIAALRQPTVQARKVVGAVAIITLIANGLLYLTGSNVITAETTLLWGVLAFLALASVRVASAQVVNLLAQAGRLRRRAVIVGGGEGLSTLIELLQQDSTHLNILGVFDDRNQDRDGGIQYDAHLNRLVTFNELSRLCRDSGVELLIINVHEAGEERLLQIIQQLRQLPVDIRIAAHSSKLRLNSKAYSFIGKVPMLPVLDRPLNDRDRMMKNLEDRIIGLAILLMAAPVMALVALAVRLESKGPVLFRQKRFGFNNELIEVYKFRSMHTDMSDAAATKLVTKDDPRVTRVGRFIRKTSLDELPQLFNVMRGDMSIVGPRPHALQAKAGDALYQDAVLSYFARHKVKPGMTGWAQINGWRGETDTLEKIEQRVEHDMHYINNWSVLLDLYIIVMTPFSLINGKNAY